MAASACAQGVSGQGMTFGGAVASVNPYCNLALLAETARAHGDQKTAARALELMREMAESDTAGWRGYFRYIPVVGGFFRFVF